MVLLKSNGLCSSVDEILGEGHPTSLLNTDNVNVKNIVRRRHLRMYRLRGVGRCYGLLYNERQVTVQINTVVVSKIDHSNVRSIAEFYVF